MSIFHDSKLAVEHEAWMRKIVKGSKRGFPFIRYDSRGNETRVEYRRGCYCLNRGLMAEKERCPEHGTIIESHPARHQSMLSE
ncbi:MAG: hypothetical protein IH897_13210 [Planctomycetes bacterium]|nr:hypothetical protein [Planctomycetota bacterium]